MVNAADIFSISGKKQFIKSALKVFRHQHANNDVYRAFCDLLHIDATEVKTIAEIPFLPIEFFKSRTVTTGSDAIEKTFTSSGTTGIITSSHHVSDLSIYEESFRRGFSHFYGPIQNYTILALLPSYLEREGSSLVYMAADMISESGTESGFYLHNYDELISKMKALDNAGESFILLGVTYALLDLIEKEKFALSHGLIMETGGMKGKRREMIREELHQQLCDGFGVGAIHSEYGMTELLSQAYSFGNGIFNCPPWMEVLVRDPEDALTYLPSGKSGGINIIDLANINSCAFIATQDLGKKYDDGTFEILGRFDHSDIRGCNLMVM